MRVRRRTRRLGAVTYGGQPISSRFDSGGGGADVEKEAVESSAYRDLRGDDSDFTYHKSVLTARWHEQSALGN